MTTAPGEDAAPKGKKRTAVELERENKRLLSRLRAAEKAKEEIQDLFEWEELQSWHIKRARQRRAARERKRARDAERIRDKRNLRKRRGLSVTPSPTQEEMDKLERARKELREQLKLRIRRTAIEILIACGGLHAWKQKTITNDNAKILPTEYDWSWHPRLLFGPFPETVIDELIRHIVGDKNPILLEDKVEYIEAGKRKIIRAGRRGATGADPPEAAPPSAPGASAMMAMVGRRPQSAPVRSSPGCLKKENSEVSSPISPETWAAEIGAFVDPESDPRTYTQGLTSEHPSTVAESVARIIATMVQDNKTPSPSELGWDVAKHEEAEDENEGVNLDDEEEIPTTVGQEDIGITLKNADDALARQWLEGWMREATEEVFDDAIIKLGRNTSISGDDFDHFANQTLAIMRENLFVTKYIIDYVLTSPATARPTIDFRPFANAFGSDFGQVVVTAIGSSKTKTPNTTTVTTAIMAIMKQMLDMGHGKNSTMVADESALDKALGPHWKLKFRKLFVDQVIPEPPKKLEPTPTSQSSGQTETSELKNAGSIQNGGESHGDPLPFDVVPNILPRKNYEPPRASTYGQRRLVRPELFPTAIGRAGSDWNRYIRPLEEANQGDMLRIAEKNERLWAWSRATYYENKYTSFDRLMGFGRYNADLPWWNNPFGEGSDWPPLDNLEELDITPEFNELISRFPLDKSISTWELPTVPCEDMDKRDDAYNGGPMPPPKKLKPLIEKPLLHNPIPFPENVPDVFPDPNIPGSEYRANLYSMVNKVARTAEAARQQEQKVRSLPAHTPTAARREEEALLEELEDEAQAIKAGAQRAWDHICENEERWEEEADLQRETARRQAEMEEFRKKKAAELQARIDRGETPKIKKYPRLPCTKGQQFPAATAAAQMAEWVSRARELGADKNDVLYPKQPELEDELGVEEDSPMEEANDPPSQNTSEPEQGSHQPEEEDIQMGNSPEAEAGPEQMPVPTPATPIVRPMHTLSDGMFNPNRRYTNAMTLEERKAHYEKMTQGLPRRPLSGFAPDDDSARTQLSEQQRAVVPLVSQAAGSPDPYGAMGGAAAIVARVAEELKKDPIPGLEPAVAHPANTPSEEQEEQVYPTAPTKKRSEKKPSVTDIPGYIVAGSPFSMKQKPQGGQQETELEIKAEPASEPQSLKVKRRPFGYFGGSLGLGNAGGFRTPVNIPGSPAAVEDDNDNDNTTTAITTPHAPVAPRGPRRKQNAGKHQKTSAKSAVVRSVRFVEPGSPPPSQQSLWSPSLGPDAYPDPESSDDAYWFDGASSSSSSSSRGPAAAAATPRGREFRAALGAFSEGAERAADRAISTVGTPGQKRARSRSRSRSRSGAKRERVEEEAGLPVRVRER